ncbi:HAMP domain-containing protein [Heliorestis acidaminivorans]|uniref:histidine kinase n=1 Tax=Heliorestis acidaminivorans TaxID=553427 RepID=A0A6I0EVS3_9FIRM|nr:ATP-binding protein [Heliorestis acidaminivorans]KAB2952068.1 HAMP domain-containing protein [Heliorestis acidaminivorans]
MKLTKRFISFFLSVATMAILLTLLLSNLTVQSSFQEYLSNRQDQDIELIKASIIREYQEQGTLSTPSLAWLSHMAVMDGYHIIITDRQKNILWQSPIPRHDHDAPREQWQEVSFPMHHDDQYTAHLYIHYRAAKFFWADPDIAFVKHLNQNLLIAGFVTILLSLIVSLLLGRYLAKPLIKMTEVTQKLQQGDLTQRVNLPEVKKEIASSRELDEINQLAQSINHLANSLEEQESLRKTLTADVAHELRTPLTTLQSYIEAFLDGLWEPDEKKLKVCFQECERLKKLAQDLELLASSEVKLAYQKELVDLSLLAEEAIELYQATAKDKNITLLLDIERLDEEENSKDAQDLTSFTMLGDRYRLMQLITNLLDNAIKYSDVGGTVSLALQRERAPFAVEQSTSKNQPESFVLRICDTGPGIAATDIPYVFERFYRGDKSRRRLTGGSGIGLAIVKAVAQGHNGSVEVEKSTSEGTTMKVILPVKK